MTRKGQYQRRLYHLKKKILVHNYTHLSATEFANAIVQNTEETIAADERNLLILFDAREAVIDKSVLTTCIKNAPRVRKYVNKMAIVGVLQMQLPFVEYVSRIGGLQAKVCTSFDEAKEWLAE